jgi:hypothetical protein
MSVHLRRDEKAGQYLAAILRFEFIIALVAAEHILKSTVHLSTFLQGEKCDLVEAVKESEVVINQLTSERNDQTVWDSLFDMAVSIADQFGADRRIELFVCDVKGVLQIRWFSGCQCCPMGFPPFDFGFKHNYVAT